MKTMNLEDVPSWLQEIIAGLYPGEPLEITKDGEPVAVLSRKMSREAGNPEIEGYWMAPDFDAPLEEFREYME